MNTNFSKIENANITGVRGVFTSVLTTYENVLAEDLPTAVKVAYEIAGLMATTYARTLDATDPIAEILTIAGELEVSPENAEELRAELRDKIRSL